MVDKLLRWLAANPRRLLAIEHEFAVRLDDPGRPSRAGGPGRPAGGRRRRPARRGRPQDRQVDRGHRRRRWRSTRSSPPTRRRSRRARSRARRRVGRCGARTARHDRKEAKEQAQGALGEATSPAGRGRWYAVRPMSCPRRRSPRWPTRAAGSARCAPVARCPARAGRSSSRHRSGAGRPDDPAVPVRAEQPRTVAADVGPALHAGRAGQAAAPAGADARAGRRHRRAGRAAAGGRRRGLGQDRDDGRAGGVAGRQRLRESRRRSSASRSPARRRASWRTASARGSASSCAASAARAATRRRPAQRRGDGLDLPLVRRPGGHRARPARRGTSRRRGCSPRRPAGRSST